MLLLNLERRLPLDAMFMQEFNNDFPFLNAVAQMYVSVYLCHGVQLSNWIIKLPVIIDSLDAPIGVGVLFIV